MQSPFHHDIGVDELGHADASTDRIEDLFDEQKDNAVYRNGLAWAYSHLADLPWQMERAEPARDYYQKALKLRRELVGEPEHLNSLARLIVACRDPKLATEDHAIEAIEAYCAEQAA